MRTTLGPYQDLAPLGSGGLGELFSARDPRLDRRIAITVLPRRRGTAARSHCPGAQQSDYCPPRSNLDPLRGYGPFEELIEPKG